MKHRLSGSMMYLAGPIDDVSDRGRGWRQDLKPFLWDLGIGALCPVEKALIDSVNEDDAYFDEINRLKQTGQYQEAHEKMRPLAADDYRMVDKADALILYIDKDAHMCGSYHENCMAAYQRKPVIVCCPEGIDAIPNWVFSVCRHEMFFDSWENVKEFIKLMCFVDNPPTYNRWRFFDADIIFGRNRQ